MAFIIPIFLVLVLGVVELGRAFAAYNTLSHSVRAAARHLSVGDVDAQRRLEAQCVVVTGLPETNGAACAASAQLPGLRMDQVTIFAPPDPAVTNVLTGPSTGSISLVSVSLGGYTLPSVTQYLVPNIPLGSISATVPFVFF
jgi:Flp pilus assembly protein TadG